MAKPTDQDGKSKTASAVDAEHYPEQNEVDQHSSWEPDRAEVATRAHELWHLRGCPDGSSEQDWFDAREELRAKVNSEKTRKNGNESGSVQP